jgi:phage shock protein C
MLRRSKKDRVIAGVCGGIGRYTGIDPIVLRVALVVLTIAGGSGILLYIIGWVAIPDEREGESVGRTARPVDTQTVRLVLGALLVGAGVIILLDLAIDSFNVWAVAGPLLLVGLGIGIVAGGMRR